MENIIIYGLGRNWALYKDIIEKNYNIVGYYDNDKEKLQLVDMRINDISEMVGMDERIVVTSSVHWSEIANELVEKGIPRNRIINFEELEIRKLHWNRKPIGGVSYSGGYEDWLIDSIIRGIGIDYCNMRYLELGVMDPVVSSNTYYFYERGARGILVEANPNLIPRIKKIRPDDLIINKAIYNINNAIIPFYISNEPGLSSVFEDHIEGVDEWRKIGLYQKIQIETITVNTLLNDIPTVDLLSIDLEGYDYEALSMVNFDKYRPKVIIAELNWFDLPRRKMYQQIVNLLYKCGYMLYYQNDYNGIFIDEKYFER